MKVQQTSSVLVSFSGPEKKGGHYVYSITGSDKNGQFNTVRRFSDFNNLRSVLSAKWPGFYIPCLPQKKFIGNQDTTFIDTRKSGLSYFIHTLKNLEHLWYSEQNQLFLRKIGDTEKDFQKMKEITMNQIMEKYNQQFPQLFGKEISKELTNQIIDFSQYLKKAKGLLENLQKMSEQIFNSRKKFNEKYFNFVQTIIPEYEKNSIEVYKNDNNFEELVFTGSKMEKLTRHYEELKKKTNSALLVLQEIRREKEEILAFEDILKTKDHYTTQKQKAISKVKDLEIQTTKIHSGKESLMSKIKGKSKDEQLKQNQSSIQKAQEDEKNFALFCQVITLLIGESEIKKFKSIRQRSYYSLVRKMFQLEKQESHLKKEFWNLVLKENHEKEELDNFFDKSPTKESKDQSEPTESKHQEQSYEPEMKEIQHIEIYQQNDQDLQLVQKHQVQDEVQVKNQVQVQFKGEVQEQVQIEVQEVKSDENDQNIQNHDIEE